MAGDNLVSIQITPEDLDTVKAALTTNFLSETGTMLFETTNFLF